MADVLEYEILDSQKYNINLTWIDSILLRGYGIVPTNYVDIARQHVDMFVLAMLVIALLALYCHGCYLRFKSSAKKT